MRKLIDIFKGLLNYLNPFNAKFLQSDWLKEKELYDRNYHHYVLTEHCRTRMKERRIIYRDLNLAFKYGKLIGNQILLDISHIPDECFQGLTNQQIKHILGHLPLVITIKPGTKIITTVYKGNNTLRDKDDIKTDAYIIEESDQLYFDGEEWLVDSDPKKWKDYEDYDLIFLNDDMYF